MATPTQQVMVQWNERSPEEALWEWLSEFPSAYPTYHLEDKVTFEEGGECYERSRREGTRRKGSTQEGRVYAQLA
ncbi:hypothetical protein Tco_0037058 [Tanacetum coccineum]